MNIFYSRKLYHFRLFEILKKLFFIVKVCLSPVKTSKGTGETKAFLFHHVLHCQNLLFIFTKSRAGENPRDLAAGFQRHLPKSTRQTAAEKSLLPCREAHGNLLQALYRVYHIQKSLLQKKTRFESYFTSKI